MLERGVCELANYFFHLDKSELKVFIEEVVSRLKVKVLVVLLKPYLMFFYFKSFLCPPPPTLKKRGHIVLHLSVSRSVWRPSDVCSIALHPFAWKLTNLVQWMPLETRCSLLIFRSKVKVKLQVFVQIMSPRRWRSGLECHPRKRKVGCSNPIRDRP